MVIKYYKKPIHMKLRTSVYAVIGSVLLGLIYGCAHVGLSAIPQTREGYNKALSTSDNEQFLLNIVRMHFGQTPYFVNVDNMVTQSTLRTGSGVDSQLSNAPTATDTSGLFWRVSPVVEFTQTPTITYSPLQGTQFVSGMLTPINLDKLALLLQSGYSTKAMLQLTVDKIGSLKNETFMSSTLSNNNFTQQKFNNFVTTLDKLEIDGSINYGSTRYNEQKALIINITDNQAAVQLSKILNLSKPYSQLIFSKVVISDIKTPENIIYIQTRSFFSMLNYLSQGITIPEENANTESASKTPIPINNKTLSTKEPLFLVSISSSEPNKTATKISFEDKWYYVPNNDSASKTTLVILRLIYSLQVGEVKANLPLITIPVK